MKISTLAMLLLLLVSCQDEGAVDSRGNKIPKTNPYGNNGNSTGGTSDGSQTGNTTNAPIDGGLSVLLLAGAAYGTRRALKRKTKSQESL
jgi:hypothetical protein